LKPFIALRRMMGSRDYAREYEQASEMFKST
jgi:hypothetical protein